MIKKLDRYLLSQFFLALLVVTIAIGLTIIVINAVEELRDFIDNDVPFISILEYYVYFGGWVIKSFLPMFVLLALLFSLSMLARKNEILAMKASGLSLYRLSLPFLAVAVLASVGHFYYNEFIFPSANKRRVEIKEFTIENRSRAHTARVSNIYRQIAPGYFYVLGSFNVARKEGTDIKVYRTEKNHLSQIITANKLIYDGFCWLAVDGVERSFTTRVGETYNEFDTLVLADIEEEPDDFARRLGKPEDMGYLELKNYIDLMKRTGVPHVRESVDLEIKLAYPLSTVMVVLLCIPFASNPRRGGIAVSVASGAIISLIYFVLFRTLQSAGYNERIPKELAAWGVNAAFLLLGLIAMIKARK